MITLSKCTLKSKVKRPRMTLTRLMLSFQGLKRKRSARTEVAIATGKVKTQMRKVGCSPEKGVKCFCLRLRKPST